MEIGRVRGSSLRTETKNISNRKDFSQSFSDAKERKSEEELKKMMGNIKKKGDRLTISKTYGDVMGYKKLIKEYLESVLQYMYENKKDISFWQTQYFITVETIDGNVKYTIPEGTQSGTVFRLKGKGIAKVQGSGRGDQYVKVVVDIPKGLNDKAKEALKAFMEATGEEVDKEAHKKKGFFSR